MTEIKDIPKSCLECHHNSEDGVWCKEIKDWRKAYVKVTEGRREGCPLEQQGEQK